MSSHDPHHSFSIALAERYGLQEALFIHHFQHWIRVNMRLKRNFHDGKTWTYQTIDVFQAHFSYLTYKQVRTILDSLAKQGVIVKGNYNKIKHDKTCWYAFADESFTCTLSGICPNGQTDVPEKADGNAQMGTPIPDDITDDKNQQQPTKSAPVSAAVFDCLINIGIPHADKEWLTSHHTEDDVKHAVAYCRHAKTVIKTSMAQTLKWAAKALPEVPIDESELIEAHSKIAQKVESEVAPCNAYVSAGRANVEICFSTGMNTPVVVAYSDKNFKQLFYDALKRFGVRKRKVA